MLPLVETANLMKYEFAVTDTYVLVYPPENLQRKNIQNTLTSSLKTAKIKETRIQYKFPYKKSNFFLLYWA